MKKLDPNAKWTLRVNAYLSLLPILFIGLWILFTFVRIADDVNDISYLVKPVLLFFIIFIILMLIFGEIYAYLAYIFWEYDITSKEVRINKGIIWKKSVSIPYAKIQNVDIKRGIFARAFGYSEILIQTAGNSNANQKRFSKGAEGYIPGVSVDEAKIISEQIIKTINDTDHGDV